MALHLLGELTQQRPRETRRAVEQSTRPALPERQRPVPQSVDVIWVGAFRRQRARTASRIAAVPRMQAPHCFAFSRSK